MAGDIISYPWTSLVTFDPSTDLPIYDRAVDAEVLRNINKFYYSDGVFADPDAAFQTTVADDGLKITLLPGGCNIKGTTGYLPYALELDIEAPGGIARTDAVVLRWDESVEVRAIVPAIVKGTTTDKPLPTRTDTVYELVLAYITVRPTAAQILLTDIEDTRSNADLCGLVRLPISVFDAAPALHAIQHASGGTDPVSPAAIGAATQTHAAQHATGGSDPVTPANIGAAKKSSVQDVTLAAASWSGGKYTISISGLAGSANVEIIPAPTITSAQLTALQDANLVWTAQAAGSITFTAFGAVPTVAIPVRLIIRGDMY